MFENFISLSSLVAFTLSITLTVKSLSISNIKNIRNNSHDISGNNNQVVINSPAEKTESDFKRLSGIMLGIFLLFFPLFPAFCLKFLYDFSLCAIVINVVGIINSIYQRSKNCYYSILYIFSTCGTAFLARNAVSHAFFDHYIFREFYGRLIKILGGFDASIIYMGTLSNYMGTLNKLLFEFIAYMGMSLLFVGLINSCFGFIKARNFDKTVAFIGSWIIIAFVAHFLASGYLIRISEGGLNYVINEYKTTFNYFFNFF